MKGTWYQVPPKVLGVSIFVRARAIFNDSRSLNYLKISETEIFLIFYIWRWALNG